jgi:hypothetical protein
MIQLTLSILGLFNDADSATKNKNCRIGQEGNHE